jgi:two-component system response regulator RegA
MSQSRSLLILDDDVLFRRSLIKEFVERGYIVHEAADVPQARNLLLNGLGLDFALVDMRVGTNFGLEILPDILETNPQCRIVVLTGYPTISTAVGSIKAGAINYLLKPSSIELIEQALWLEKIDETFSLDDSDSRLTRLDHYETELIEFVMIQCNWNVSKAAQRLGLHRQSLQRKLRKYPSTNKVEQPD